MSLRVTQYGESILKEKGAPVTAFDAALRKLSEQMIETMREAEGIGLAAQQIGQAIQLFVMELPSEMDGGHSTYTVDGKCPPLDLIMPLVVVNPVIELSGEDAPYEEGCLSFPNIRGKVERPISVKMDYQDLDGKAHQIICDGLFARVIQHEYDHLQGVLFIDRMRPQVLRMIESKVRRLRRDTRDWLKANKR